jgi:hypothetical protein
VQPPVGGSPKGLHSLLTVCMGLLPVRTAKTYAHAGFGGERAGGIRISREGF